MKFKLPEDIKALTGEELDKLYTEALAEYKELLAIDDADITDEQLDALEEVGAAVEALDVRRTEIVAEAQARTDRIAAARTKINVEEAEAEAETDPADETEEDGEGEDLDAEAEKLIEEEKEKTVVTASGSRRKIVKSAVPEPEVEVESPRFTLTAAANVPGFESGAEMSDFDQVVEAFIARSRSFAGTQARDRFDRYGVAKLNLPSSSFTVDNGSFEKDWETIMEAAKESRLPGGSLTAAGGWCAPSETLYDFCSLESPDGYWDLPTITVTRGGFRYTKGPDFSTISDPTTWGFLQTEAQAEAGTAKTCYTVECPPFTEIRLDAIGFCIKAGILTASPAGYPELIRRVLEIGTAAHARKVNYQVISRIVAFLGAAVAGTVQGAGTTSILGNLELQAELLREKFIMSQNATLEVKIPAWTRGLIRQDLANRGGDRNFLSVSDAEIAAYFSARKLRVQFVSDWQNLGAAATEYPATVQAAIYPAGAFVKGTSSVIDLDTVYDSVGLSTNTYTAAFFEQGLLVANTCGTGKLVTIPICDSGAVGAAELTCTVTP
jgi:hypothetical protein